MRPHKQAHVFINSGIWLTLHSFSLILTTGQSAHIEWLCRHMHNRQIGRPKRCHNHSDKYKGGDGRRGTNQNPAYNPFTVWLARRLDSLLQFQSVVQDRPANISNLVQYTQTGAEQRFVAAAISQCGRSESDQRGRKAWHRRVPTGLLQCCAQRGTRASWSTR